MPTIFPILRERKLALAMFASGTFLLFLFATGVGGWPCPFLHATGIPCPGCGLTRATLLLLSGDLRGSLAFHAFAPIATVGLLLVGSAGVLPERPRQRWIEILTNLEHKTGIVLILLVGLILYWVGRLVFLNADFMQLIRG
jgi:hypothetical protein